MDECKPLVLGVAGQIFKLAMVLGFLVHTVGRCRLTLSNPH